MNHDEMIAVIQAHKDGKQIQWKSRNGVDEWDDCSDGYYQPKFNFGACLYRVKPEPREFWIHPARDRVCEYYDSTVAKDEGFLHVREVLE